MNPSTIKSEAKYICEHAKCRIAAQPHLCRLCHFTIPTGELYADAGTKKAHIVCVESCVEMKIGDLPGQMDITTIEGKEG